MTPMRQRLIEAARRAAASQAEPMSEHERIGGGLYSRPDYVEGWNDRAACGVTVEPILDAILDVLREPDEEMVSVGLGALVRGDETDHRVREPFQAMIDKVRER